METITRNEIAAGAIASMVAYLFLLGNVAFGAAVRFGWIDNARIRFIHHGLFFCTVACMLVALVCTIPGGSAHAIAVPAVLTAMLFVMPFLPGRRNAHWIYACACLAAFTVALLPMLMLLPLLAHAP